MGGGFGALRALAVRVANADILEDIIVIIITVIFDHANSKMKIDCILPSSIDWNPEMS